MMKSITRALGLVVIVTSASITIGSCSSPYYTDIGITQVGHEENQKQDDISIAKKLNTLIENRFPNIEVRAVSDHFNILLVGQVNTQNTQTELENLVKRQLEVKKVFNYTTISATPELKYDSSLTSDAKDRVATEYNIDPYQVTIIAVDRVVYAMGTNIGDLTSLKEALDGVAALKKVTKVVNLVQPGNQDYYSVKSR